MLAVTSSEGVGNPLQESELRQPDEEIQYRLHSDPDFICNRRYGYSLNRLMAKYPDGVSSKVAAKALMITEDELETLEQQIINKLRKKLKIK